MHQDASGQRGNGQRVAGAGGAIGGRQSGQAEEPERHVDEEEGEPDHRSIVEKRKTTHKADPSPTLPFSRRDLSASGTPYP